MSLKKKVLRVCEEKVLNKLRTETQVVVAAR
jgi:hypothetical protein